MISDSESPLMSPIDFMAGGGEMRTLIRSLDWSKTPIGPVESWSPTLRVIVSFLLANRFPLLLWWGPQYCQLYNDAYRPVLGDKHPKSLGQPASQCFPEIWQIIGPLIDTPFNGGPATWMEDIQLEYYKQRDFLEEAHFTIAYSPVPDDTAPGAVGGVLATVHEITEKVVGERRVLVLRDLSSRCAEAKTAEQACSIAAETLARHSKDIPFALLYLIDADRKRAQLAGTAGLGMAESECPIWIALDGQTSREQPWPLADVIAEQAIRFVDDLSTNLLNLPPGPWADPPRSAVLLPIRSGLPNQLAGVLVLGLSSRLRFDQPYRDFCELVSSQVATAIANARAYEEERKRAEALAEIDRAKTAFFSNVSHEFRTPLTLILGPLEDMLARADGPLSASREELDLVRRNAVRLLKLVNSLLDFSRIEAGRTHAFYEPVDLANFTAELASVFRSAIEKAGLQLSVDCPQLGQVVYVDRAMWEKIVLNLLSNALKFTFEGDITVSVAQVGQYAELSVSDTGIGIAEHELPRIFDRFHRVEGVHGRTYEGSGIGLALVRELSKLHGGSVRAESTYGRGSRFTVSIPLGQAHLPVEHMSRPKQSFTVGAGAYAQETMHWLPDAPTASSVKEVGTSRRSTGRILLADDNADMRGYVQRLLAGRYEVQAVGDGQAALKEAFKNPPDLVLTDIMMPRLDGFELLQALRDDARTRDVPVILLTARAGEESRVEGLEAGADDYLVKPFGARELMARVSSRLELGRLHREAREKERFIEQIAELTPVVLNVFDLMTERDIYVSCDVATLIGYTRNEITQMTDSVSLLWHPDDIHLYKDNLAHWKRMEDGEVFQFHYRVRHRDGQWRWLETRVMPFLRNERGDVRQVVTATVDVTARKQMEEALRVSEERFRRYFELGLIGMAITSPEKGILEVNDEICRILCYERSELLKMTWAELTHPEDVAADVAQFERVMAGELDGYSIDKRWIRKDGKVIDSTISVKCVRRQDGSVDYFVALLEDVTLRKEAQEVQKQTHTILESISDGFFALDRDWRFTYVNAAGEKLAGKNRHQLLGHNVWEVFPEAEGTVFEQQYRRAVAENVPMEFESYYAPFARWYWVNAYPLGPQGLAINSHDVTEKKVAQIEIARKNQELQQLLARIAEMAEAEKLVLQNQLAAELAAVTSLHEFSTRLLASTELHPLLEELLDATISLQSADFGDVQLYNPDSQTLEIVAQRGFHQDFLDQFRTVHDDETACGRAMKQRTRIVVEDVQTDPGFEPHRRIAASAGFRAVQSTPLFSRTGELLGMISTHFRQPHRPSDHQLRLTDLYAVHAAELIARKQSEAVVLRYQQELRALTANLIEAQEQEGKLLARELHDVFSQKLAVLGMEIAALGQTPTEFSQLKRRLQQFTEQIGVLSKEIHQISRQLHPAILDDLGLEAAIRNECLFFRQQYGVPAEFQSGNVPKSLSADISLCLYRVAQESLRNIGKHARATDVRVNLSAGNAEIVLTIVDIGDGFDVETARGKGGLGLVSMEERIRLVNGMLFIRSQPGNGTHVEVRVPLHLK